MILNCLILQELPSCYPPQSYAYEYPTPSTYVDTWNPYTAEGIVSPYAKMAHGSLQVDGTPPPLQNPASVEYGSYQYTSSPYGMDSGK